MANNYKKGIDRLMWVNLPPAPTAHAAGMGMASDLRNDLSRNPFAYQLASNTVLNRFNFISKAWNFVISPALAGTFGAGAGCIFAPSFSLIGNVGAGSTSTSVVTSTTITAVAPNMFANRGGSGEYGFRVRIIGNRSGGSGKIEERWIIGNTGGTTPTLLLESALSFTPGSGDTYEILGGRVFLVGASTLAANIFKSWEVASNTLAALTQTNLPATISTDFSAVALDELYVPYDKKPGEGFISGSSSYDASASKMCLVATGTSASALTGMTSGGDNSVLANEYRNFQIRIVEDTAIPTAVNQRRMIASHTSGSGGAPVYTLGSSWTVTPSATAKYVIEYPNLIVLWSSGATTTYVYNYTNATINNGTNSITAGAWSTAYFAARGSAMGAGCTSFASFGIEPDSAKNARHSYIYSFRGGNSTALDMLDISGGTTGTWSNAIVYDGSGMATFNTGTSGKYAPFDNEGRFGYLNAYVASQFNQFYRFDVRNRVLSSFTPTDWIQSGTAASGDRIATCAAIDGNDKYSMILMVNHLSTTSEELLTLF